MQVCSVYEMMSRTETREIWETQRKDTGVFNDDVSGGLVENHLVENINDLAHELIILLLGYRAKTHTDM